MTGGGSKKVEGGGGFPNRIFTMLNEIICDQVRVVYHVDHSAYIFRS